MTNKFTEKEVDCVKRWELEVDLKIPCSEEEKRIYGVEFKLDPNVRKPFIVEQEFADGGNYYVVFSNIYNSDLRRCFKSLEKAKEFLIKEYIKEKNDK